jgi:hypothetical protein
MYTDEDLLNDRREEIRILLDRLTYARDAHAQDEIHEQLRHAIADARRLRQRRCATVSPD